MTVLRQPVQWNFNRTLRVTDVNNWAAENSWKCQNAFSDMCTGKQSAAEHGQSGHRARLITALIG
jgi:hypothetical protein